MTDNQRSHAEKPTSMSRADVANGEAPDPAETVDEEDPGAGIDHRRAEHPTGSRQAEENHVGENPAS